MSHGLVRLTATAAVSLLGIGQADRCQGGPSGPTPNPYRGEAEKQFAADTRSTANVSSFGDATPEILLESTTEEKRATARFGVRNGGFLLDVRLEGPLDAATREARPVSLDGLATGTTADLGVTWTIWNAGDMRQVDMDRICVESGQSADRCSHSRMNEALRRRYLYAAGNFTPVLLGVRVRGGRNRFKYADQTTFEQSSVVHDNWSVSASAGVFKPSVGLLALRYEYQSVFVEGAGAREICAPQTETDALECRSLVLAPPREKKKSILRGEWRRFLPGGRVAVDLLVSHDFNEKVSSIDLPIYILTERSDKDGKGGLTGGARFGWRSDTDDFTLGVFVGGRFKLFD
jgi:hypothetical protein